MPRYRMATMYWRASVPTAAGVNNQNSGNTALQSEAAAVEEEEAVPVSLERKRKKSAYHCCVPRCNGDSRYHQDLRFHRIPGRDKDKQLKAQWLVKIRRDEGPYFKITSNTRVCSRHFGADDYKEPDSSGRRLLKEGAVPSIFDWAAEPKTRRKIVRHTNRLTDTEDLAEEQRHDTEDDAMKMELLEEELRSLQIELDETKDALFRTKSELEASKRLAKEEMEKEKEEVDLLQDNFNRLMSCSSSLSGLSWVYLSRI
eukprot:gene15521-6784_t